MTVVKTHIYLVVSPVILHGSELILFILWEDCKLIQDWKSDLLLTSEFRAS